MTGFRNAILSERLGTSTARLFPVEMLGEAGLTTMTDP